MANKIISTNSTLGAFGTIISDQEIAAASCTVDQLVEHGVIEIVADAKPTTTKTTTKEEE
jgi:hypothetical protein